MPTKRQRRGRHRQTKTVNSLSFPEIMAFSGGWSPPGSRGEPSAASPGAQSREIWRSWTAFLADWQAVRDDWAANPPADIPFDETFAEWLLQRYGADGPPDMECERDDRFPALIPLHPVLEQFKLERETLSRLPGR